MNIPFAEPDYRPKPGPSMPPMPMDQDDGHDDNSGDAATEAEQKSYDQRQDYASSRLSAWMAMADEAHRLGFTRVRQDALLTYLQKYLIGETHQVEWPVLWKFFWYLNLRFPKPLTEGYTVIIGGCFGDQIVPSDLMPRSLLGLFRRLGDGGLTIDLLATAEKELMELPGPSFTFPQTRDGVPGWRLLCIFLSGYQALPTRVKERHAPYHFRLELPASTGCI